ncbi:hypothetical protein F4808DRAFT_413810 [Astrocystis sublimbata]|nr:hypothetical protein F4808DRAFT_413810 [Astrocystis sublimbata]
MGVPVDPDGSQGIGSLSLGLTFALAGLGVFIVAARFLLRYRNSRPLGADDWIMLLALISQVVFQAFFTVEIRWGGGLAYDNLTSLQRANVSKWRWIADIPSILVSCVSRISVTIMLVHTFGAQRWLKWYLICFTSVLAVISAVRIVLLARHWDPTIYAYVALATQFLYAISDLTLVLFPVLVISKPDMPRRRKVAIGTILALALIAVGIVVIKICMAILHLTNVQASIGSLARLYPSLADFFACLEQWLVIIMGCIPTLELPEHIKLPALKTMGSWVAGLVSPRSGQSSSSPCTSGHNSSHHDLDLVPKIHIPDETNTYTVTLRSNTPNLDVHCPASKIVQKKEFSVEYG